MSPSLDLSNPNHLIGACLAVALLVGITYLAPSFLIGVFAGLVFERNKQAIADWAKKHL